MCENGTYKKWSPFSIPCPGWWPRGISSAVCFVCDSVPVKQAAYFACPILTAAHGTWKGRCHEVPSKCQRFRFVDKEWYWFPPSLRNTSNEQIHGDLQGQFELFPCVFQRLPQHGLEDRGLLRAETEVTGIAKKGVSFGPTMSMESVNLWSNRASDSESFEFIPPFWVPCTLKILEAMTWKLERLSRLTKSTWQVTFWRGAFSTRRSFSVQVQR